MTNTNTEREVEIHNRGIMWEMAEQHLDGAVNCLNNAAGLLEDLDAAHLAENLRPLVESAERFRDLAKSKVQGLRE